MGNALEFYDFTLCGVFIPILSQVFFPHVSARMALLASLFAFSAAFWTRPLGAYLFGLLGDRKGRKSALTLSVLLMGLPTMLIGLLPGFEVLGWVAPVVLIAFRMIQGLCTGGEYNGAAIFALEHHYHMRQGLISGLISGSCVIGALAATLVGLWLQGEGMPTWAWRVAFVGGGAISFIGYWLRRFAAETGEYAALKRSDKSARPLRDILKTRPYAFGLAVAAGAYNGILSYTLFGFLALYINRYGGVRFSEGIFYNLFGLLTFMVTCPLFGAWSDRLGLRRSTTLACFMGMGVAPLAFVLLLMQHSGLIILGQCVLGMVVGSFVGISHVFLKALFPVQWRYTGSALGFSLGMALTGGTTALILTTLIDWTGYAFMPALYIVVAAALMYGAMRLGDRMGSAPTL
jgi:MHS family proline/betaine transporter-like MFS transporter